MAIASKKEIAEATADAEWWRELAVALGMSLHAFTYRNVADFRDGNGNMIEIPASLAHAMRGALGI